MRGHGLALANSLLDPFLPSQMVAGHDTVGISLTALLTACMARRAIAADLAATTVHAGGLFSMLAG